MDFQEFSWDWVERCIAFCLNCNKPWSICTMKIPLKPHRRLDIWISWKILVCCTLSFASRSEYVAVCWEILFNSCKFHIHFHSIHYTRISIFFFYLGKLMPEEIIRFDKCINQWGASIFYIITASNWNSFGKPSKLITPKLKIIAWKL